MSGVGAGRSPGEEPAAHYGSGGALRGSDSSVTGAAAPVRPPAGGVGTMRVLAGPVVFTAQPANDISKAMHIVAALVRTFKTQLPFVTPAE